MAPKIKTSHGASRLTAYALLIAIESDLRALASDSFDGEFASPSVLTAEELEALTVRLRADQGASLTPTLSELLVYTDFGQIIQIINRNCEKLTVPISTTVKATALMVEKLAPIRNRVMHSRPLLLDDLPTTLDISVELAKTDGTVFRSVKDELDRISRDPSYVLSLEIPTLEKNDVSNNLPIPDFDETGFVGRRDVSQRLSDQLCKGAYPVITIVGEGGLGKTALALKVAYDVLDAPSAPFDAVVWVTTKATQLTAHEIVRIDGAIRDSLGLFKDVANQLGGSAVDNAEPLSEILGYMREFKILLIIDNLETVLDDRIRGFVSQIPLGSKVLITSRIGLGAFEFPERLQPLSSGEAVHLLRSLARVRGLQRLVKSKPEELASLCDRMNCNPGWIKWFVAAVQSGRRPEEVVANPKLFLEFCMSNVYEYLSDLSRGVLDVMITASGAHSQASLAYLGALDPLVLQHSLHELLATNMVRMVGKTSSGSLETFYEVSELALVYLKSKHPVDIKKLQDINRRRSQLVAEEERMLGTQGANRYDRQVLHVRSKGDVIPAKFLREALELSKQGKIGEAIARCSIAQSLAPDYFESFRVEAGMRLLANEHSAAMSAYERAVALEPNWAPLRFFFGSFLLGIDNPVDALEQFRFAQKFDPSNFMTDLEACRALLFLRRFEDAHALLGALLVREGIPRRRRIKVFDAHLQYFQRRAEYSVEIEDDEQAAELLRGLLRAFDAIPGELVDDLHRKRLSKAVPTAMTCIKREFDSARRRELMKCFLELQQRAHERPRVVTAVDRTDGEIRFAGSTKEFSVGRGDLVNPSDWERIRVGSYVYYCIVGGAHGPKAAVILD